MGTDRVKTVAATVTIGCALLLLYFSWHEAPPKPDSRLQEALGQVLVEVAGKLLSGDGRITLIGWDTSAVQNPTADLQLSGFLEALQRAKRTLYTTNLINQDPLRLLRVPPGDFLQILRKHSESDVIVSLLGPPILKPDQRASLGENRPRVVALCSGSLPEQVNLRELFDQNLLHVAIISRRHPGPAVASSPNLRDSFDQLYQVVTAANLSELPPLNSQVSK